MCSLLKGVDSQLFLLAEEILGATEFSLLLCIVYSNNMVALIVYFCWRKLLNTWKQTP